MKTRVFLILAVCTIYLSGCKYDPTSSPGSIVVVRPSAGDTIIGGTKNYQVTWSGTGINAVKTFEYSLDSGLSWTTIGTQNSDSYLYNWNVPDTTGDHSFLRIIDKNGVTGKSGQFTIVPSTPPGPGKTIPPHLGSSFRYRNTTIDTNGVPILSTVYFTTDSVVATGMTYMGKSNVSHVVTIDQTNGTQSDTYLNYESNGDVSFYSGGGGGIGFGGGSVPDWILFGAQSHITSTFVLADTSLDLLGNGTSVHIIVSDSVFFANNGVFPIAGKNIAVINMTQSVNVKALLSIIPIFSSSQVSHISLSPFLGYYTVQRTDPGKGLFPGAPASEGNESVLIGYTLR